MKPTKLVAQESYVKGLEAELEKVNSLRRIVYHHNIIVGDALWDVVNIIGVKLAQAKTELTRLQELRGFIQEEMTKEKDDNTN